MLRNFKTYLITTSSLALLLSGLAYSSTEAQGIQNLAWLAGEIRGQMALVEAQAEATLHRCDEYEDVQEELQELCQKMNRFEQLLASPISCHKDINRLAKQADRVRDQADEVLDEIEDALDDLRDDFDDDYDDDRYRFRNDRFGYRGPEHFMLPPVHANARNFGYTVPSFASPSTRFVSNYHNGLSFRSGSVRFTLGGGRPQVQLVSNPGFLPAPPHVMNHGPVWRGDSIRSLTHEPGYYGNVRSNSPQCALRNEAEKLHQLTCQLVRSLR